MTNMKFINNPGIADWLNQYNSTLGSRGVDEYVAECIYGQLSLFSPSLYAKSEYSTLQFRVQIPYTTIRDLFGYNFIGLIINDGEDRSKIIEDLQKFDVDNKDATRYNEFNKTISFNRYYAFANCPLAIRLYEINIFYVKGPSFGMPMPEITLRCEIVNKDKATEEE